MDILPALFSRVVAPPAVIDELLHPAAPEVVRVWAVSPPNWLKVISPARTDERLRLGRGEREAIALALELHADVPLLDERKAMAVALRMGLRTAGTIAVLELASEKRLLDLAKVVAELRQTNFRCPDEVFDALLRRCQRRVLDGKNPESDDEQH